jgi:hypothetical protein
MKCHYCGIESNDLVKGLPATNMFGVKTGENHMVCKERNACRSRELDKPLDGSGHDLFCQETWDGEINPCNCGKGSFPGEY